MKIKVTDLIADFFKKKNINQVFGVTGGAAVHFFDSFQKYKYKIIFTHHEQTASFAVSSYYKTFNKVAICSATTGPGATNAITGLAAAWQDSVPSIFIVGQARSNQLSRDTKTRQVGTQEIDTINIVKSITKFATTIKKTDDLNHVLQKAYEEATSNRPGPVWIEIPIDIQISELNLKKIIKRNNNNLNKKISIYTKKKLLSLNKLILKSKKPVIVAGNGIITSKSTSIFKKFVNHYKIPYVCTWLGSNLSKVNNILYCGRLGISGQRGANILVHNSDLVLSLGSHLCFPQTGNVKSFSPNSKKILVDIDKKEFLNSKIKFDQFINLDLNLFFNQIIKNKNPKKFFFNNQSLNKLKQLNEIDKSHLANNKKINQYHFIDCLNRISKGNENFVIDGGGINVYVAYQGLKLKKKQKIIHTASICSMGSGLPESIGSGLNDQNVICLIGDGSLMFNMQELQTIKTNKCNIKIIVFNNNGYVSIRDTQREFLKSNFLGSSIKGGVEVTKLKKIAKAFDYNYIYLKDKNKIDQTLNEFVKMTKYTILEVFVDPNQKIAPKQIYKKSNQGMAIPSGLDNMYPYIDYKKNIKF